MNYNINNEENQSVVKISMDRFKFNEGKFCLSYDFDVNPLIKSIKEVGIINKPVVRSYRGGDIEIVTGYRRILALKELKLKEVLCIDIAGSGKTDVDMLIMNIHDNLHTRKLNNVEKSMALNRLVKYSRNKR